MINSTNSLRNKLILKVGSATGFRVGSLSNLKKKDINYRSETITAKKCKNGKDVCVPIKKDLIKDIKHYLENLKEGER